MVSPPAKRAALGNRAEAGGGGEQVGVWEGRRPAETQTEKQAREEVREDALPSRGQSTSRQWDLPVQSPPPPPGAGAGRAAQRSKRLVGLEKMEPGRRSQTAREGGARPWVLGLRDGLGLRGTWWLCVFSIEKRCDLAHIVAPGAL